MNYYTADIHFGDDAIVHCCNRPFNTVEQHDREIIKKFNSILKPEDELYVIGDLSMSKDFDYLKNCVESINCRKHLILGNHDNLKPFEYVDIGFQTVHTALVLHHLNVILVHDPAVATINRSKFFICGHIHDLFKIIKNVLNVGVDIWEYKPVSHEQVHTFAITMGFDVKR